MRFPLALTAKIASHIVKHKLRKTPKFAMVLQLEPLHTCNLTCTGCGRIREYSTSLKDMMRLEDCLESAVECEAPMVSICGGEPLIYPKIEELVNGILAQGRIVYICTNGVFMRKKMRDYMAAVYGPRMEPKLARLVAEKLVTEKEAEAIRQADDKARAKCVIRPTRWMYWNVHIDGLEYTHDLIVEREGVFRECVDAIKMAKILEFQVATNTTVYKETEAKEIEQMFEFFSALEVDGHTISPGYDYDAAKKDMVKRLGRQPEHFFLTREMTRKKFANIEDWGRRFTIFGTPVYQEFLAGKRELTCTAWAIPTRNIRGWKAPCYLMTDGHYAGYQEMLREGRMGQVRRGRRQGPRPALRELHGPLRLRPERGPRDQLPARGQLEEFQLQLRGEAQTVQGRAEGRGVQRGLDRQGPPGRSEGGFEVRSKIRPGRRSCPRAVPFPRPRRGSRAGGSWRRGRLLRQQRRHLAAG